MIDFVNFIYWWPFQSHLFRLFRRSSIKYDAREVAIGFASVATTYRNIIQWINQPFNQSSCSANFWYYAFNSAIPLFCIQLQEYKTEYSGFSSKFHIIHICHKGKSDFFLKFMCGSRDLTRADINPSLELFVLIYMNSSYWYTRTVRVDIHEQFDTVRFSS